MDSRKGIDAGDHNENDEESYSRVFGDKGDGDNVEPNDDEAVVFE